jgi:hypothetical protein
MNRFLSLAAIILPIATFAFLEPCFLLGKACKAMEAEGKHVTQTSNRAQQGYYIDYGRLASSPEALGQDFIAKGYWYEYSFQSTPTSAFFYAVPIKRMASARMGYVGAVFENKKAGENASLEELVLEIVCEAKGPKTILQVKPTLQNGFPTCPKGSTQTKVPR